MQFTFRPTRPEKSPEQLSRDLIASGIPRDAAERAAAHLRGCRLYIDATNTYQVDMRPVDPGAHGFRSGTLWHLTIRRVDRQPIGDWQVKQAIKNALLGEDCEAVELYPAEARLIDTANLYHLFGFCEPFPDAAMPFGLLPWPMLHQADYEAVSPSTR